MDRLTAFHIPHALALIVVVTSCSGGDGGPTTQTGDPARGKPVVSVSCQSADFECGALDDGTGHFIACGSCDAPRTCGGARVPGHCGCTPRSCEMVGANCGSVDDGCGGTLECGGCSDPDTCGGSRLSNVCGHPVCDGALCFEAPYPQPDDLFAVFEDQKRGVWAGGAMGRALIAGQTAWQNITSFTRNPADIEGLWMSGDGDGWAVGSGGRGALLRFDGIQFDCSRPDGTFWAELNEETDITWDLHAISGTAADELWAVGDQGILHFDGQRWVVELDTRSRAQLFAIAGGAGGEAWAVGRSASNGKPVIMQRTSKGWMWVTPDNAAALKGELRTVSISESGEVWVGGATLGEDGTALESLVLRRDIEGVWSRLPTYASAMLHASAVGRDGRVWFGGARGTLLRSSASGVQKLPPLLGHGDVRALSRGRGELRAAGEGGLLAIERRGLWWPNRTQALMDAAERKVPLWQLDPGWVWAGGRGWLMHFDGRRWGTAAVPANVVGFFGVAPDALWIAANDEQGGVVFFYDGSAFAVAARSDLPFDSLTGTSSTDVRATGGKHVLHYDGGAWTMRSEAAFVDAPKEVPVAPSWELDPQAGFVKLTGDKSTATIWPYLGLEQGASTAWGAGDADVWAAGPDGLLHVGATTRLLSVCGSVRALGGRRTDAGPWLVGDAVGPGCGPLWKVVDGVVQDVAAPKGETQLNGVSVDADGGVWVAGARLHRRAPEAADWQAVGPRPGYPFAFVQATASGEVWAAAGPELFHLHEGEWETLSAWDLFDVPPVGVHSKEAWLHDVYALPSGELFFIGTTPEREAALLLLYIEGEFRSALPLQAFDGESVFTDVWAASRSEIYVSKGELGYVYRFDATHASSSFDDVEAVMNDPLGALWGNGDGHLWMFGAGGAIVHRGLAAQ